jgi:hypothetical protein
LAHGQGNPQKDRRREDNAWPRRPEMDELRKPFGKDKAARAA